MKEVVDFWTINGTCCHVSAFSRASSLFHTIFLSFLCLPGGLQAFRGFLRSEFSEENLKFWLACEDYRASPSKTKASSIYSQFINTDAPQEVGGEEVVMRYKTQKKHVIDDWDFCDARSSALPLRSTWMLRPGRFCWAWRTQCVPTRSTRRSTGSTVWWPKTPSPGSCALLTARFIKAF